MAQPTHKSIFAIPLVREITIVLLLKLVVITIIKWQFFSDPVDMTHANRVVEQHMGIAKPHTEYK